MVRMPRFDTPDGAAADLPRGVPTRRIGGHLVTTVFDLLLAQYGVGRSAAGRLCPGSGHSGYDDAGSPYTPAWQEAITGVPAVDRGPDRPRVRRERRGVPAAAR